MNDSTTVSPATVYFSEAITRDDVQSKEFGQSDIILGVWLSPDISQDVSSDGANTVISLELRDDVHETPLQTYLLRPGEFVTAIGDRTFCANGPSRCYGSEIYVTFPSKRDVPPWAKKHVRFVCALYNCPDARRELWARHTISDIGDGMACQTINGLFCVFVWASYDGKKGAKTIAQYRERNEYGEYAMVCGPYTGPPDNCTRLRTVKSFERELIAAAWSPRRHVDWCLDTMEQAEILAMK